MFFPSNLTFISLLLCCFFTHLPLFCLFSCLTIISCHFGSCPHARKSCFSTRTSFLYENRLLREKDAISLVVYSFFSGWGKKAFSFVALFQMTGASFSRLTVNVFRLPNSVCDLVSTVSISNHNHTILRLCSFVCCVSDSCFEIYIFICLSHLVPAHQETRRGRLLDKGEGERNSLMNYSLI